jgi:hypothetical protein
MGRETPMLRAGVLWTVLLVLSGLVLSGPGSVALANAPAAPPLTSLAASVALMTPTTPVASASQPTPATLASQPAAGTLASQPTPATLASQPAAGTLASQPTPATLANQTVPAPRIYQSTKGFVVARTGDVLTLAVGHRTVEVIVTATSQVAGLRASVASLAPDDLVRVEGWYTAGGRLIADRVVVLLVGRSAVVRSSGMVLPRVLAWILDGGVTVPLP